MSAYPRAPLVTSLAAPEYRRRYGARLHTSSLQRLPVDGTSFRALMPLYARAFNEVPLPTAEVVICSSSGWAHGGHAPPLGAVDRVLPHAGAVAVARRRVLPGQPPAPRPRSTRAAAWPASRTRSRVCPGGHPLRRQLGRDRRAHPPLLRDRGRRSSIPRSRSSGSAADRPREEFYLVVSRLLDYKRIDLAVAACTQLRRRLVVVGTGPALHRLRASGGPTVSFVGAPHRRAGRPG